MHMQKYLQFHKYSVRTPNKERSVQANLKANFL